jgi:drug/metabolite transporter (DMT)-like permease
VNNKKLQPYIWILVSGFAFSWMVTFAVLAGRGVSWQIVAVARCSIPLVVVALWVKWDGAKLVVWGSPILWLRSLAGSCSLLGTFYALSFMPIADIYAIANIFPLWIALLSWPMLGRFPSGMVWVSIVSSIVGVALIQGAELSSGKYAALIVVAMSLFTAIAMMGLNRLKHLDPRAVVVHFSGTALAFAVLSLFIFPWQEPVEPFSAIHGLELIAIGLTAAIGQYYLTKAFTSGDPARVSVASLSQFVFVLVLDVVVLGNALDWSKLWGIPLILGPTAWLMLQRVKKSSLAANPPSVQTTEPAEIAPAPVEWAICPDPAACNDLK